MKIYYTDQYIKNTSFFKAKQINRDIFNLFKLHFPEKIFIKPNGMVIIYRDDNKTKKSLFNYLGTNFTGIAYIFNNVIDRMIKTRMIENEIVADPDIPEGYNMIINFLKRNKEYFKNLLPEVGNIITKTSNIGRESEKIATEILKKCFGNNIQIESMSEIGDELDTFQGIDKIVTSGIDKYTIQVKTIRRFELIKDYYKIECVSAKDYFNIDFFIFISKSEYLVFWGKYINGSNTLKLYGDEGNYYAVNKNALFKKGNINDLNIIV